VTSLATTHGPLPLPAFLPDATRAVVKALDADDLVACGVEALMVNALHLAGSPGVSRIEALGGAHAFMGWRGPIASDSGGFQAFSMIGGKAMGAAVAPDAAGVSDEGLRLKVPGRARSEWLTPERSLRQQMRLGADILFCLDQCPPPRAPASVQREAVRRTVAWAERCRREFAAALEEGPAGGSPGGPAATPPVGVRPLLFAVVQGGDDPDLRRECTERLLALGFDGYGFGGWPVDDSGTLIEMVSRVAQWLPPEAPKHGLGIGKPETLVEAWHAGYRLFDCVIPTRDGRHGRLYRHREDPAASPLQGRAFYDEIGITHARYERAREPVEPGCPCPLCRNYPAAYLHHLFEIRDPSAARLATMHNLVFYTRLIRVLRERA
jgi:queuine tRNA-ribosyltransferase